MFNAMVNTFGRKTSFNISKDERKSSGFYDYEYYEWIGMHIQRYFPQKVRQRSGYTGNKMLGETEDMEINIADESKQINKQKTKKEKYIFIYMYIAPQAEGNST